MENLPALSRFSGVEQKVTAAVLKHLKDSVQLQVTEIVRDDGSVLCDWDGVVQSKLNDQAVLVFVEAKHSVKTEDLDSVLRGGVEHATPMRVKLSIMQGWLNDLHEPQTSDNPQRQRQLERQYDEFRRCKHFL